MQEIKFDFEATKQLIYAPNSTAPIGAPVDADGNVANDGTAIGIAMCRKNESNKYWVKQNLVVMVSGYCDIIDAQAIWGNEYSAEAIAAMSDITFCDNHKIPGGSDPVVENAKATGGIGWTENSVVTLVAPVTAETQGSSGNVFGEFTMGNNVDFEPIARAYDQQYPDYNLFVKINDKLYAVSETSIDDDDNVVQFFFNNGYGNITQYMGQLNKFNMGVTDEDISAGTTTVSIFTGSETVHTIDPKYISGGAGGMVVHFELDTASEEPTLIADKTVDEVKTAMLTMPVSGILTANGRNLAMSLMSNYNGMYLCFAVLASAGEDDGYQSTVLVHEENGEWVLYG